MESPVVFVMILTMMCCTTDHVRSEIISASENPLPVGSNVTLYSEADVMSGAWIFDDNIIVFITPENAITANNWNDRVIFNSTTSSLTVMSLQLEDSGVYTLLAINSFRAQLDLSVQVPISNVTLMANATNLVEFNDTAVLMCSVSNGSSLSYTWLNGSSIITPGGGVQISDGGSTLTIAEVTRYDEGPFSCNASNGISQEMSLPLRLNISYGPSNMTLWIMPMEHTYRTGSTITLSCSADSSPPAMIQWMVDGMYLNESGPQLQLEEVTESNSGIYECLLHNTVTARVSRASAMIWIMDPIVAVVVNYTGGPAILHEAFTLHCEVIGSVDRIQWWRNGHLISADNTTMFGMDNKTLTVDPVQHSDGGDYQCQAFNAVSNMTSSPYTVELNYGPMTPVIMGASVALTGTLETLKCSSTSHPPSHISWYFNNTLVAATPEYQIGPLTLNMSGEYTCMAYNNVTGKNSTANKMLTVLAPVTMASVKMIGDQPILNRTFTLTCETAGSVEVIMWMYLGIPLYADQTGGLSMNNATLTFDPVMLSDNGNYSCEASNALSRSTSENFTLTVAYGPELPTIMGPHVTTTGRNITLSCSAASHPPSHYKWYFNDSLVANTSEYVASPNSTDMSGVYTCMAFNHVTGNNSSANWMLTVFDPIKSVQVEAPINPAIEGYSYNLTCDVTGPAEHVYWMKNGYHLYADNRTIVNMYSKTIIFHPLERTDAGDYKCMAINPAENMTSLPHKLIVNYGPDMPVIDGPSYAETGHYADFHCSAMSVPPSMFSWWYNGSLVANTSVYTTGVLSLNMSGEYICMAYNNVTEKNSINSKLLTVIEAIESVMVKYNTIPINTQNFTLTCEVIGPYNSIHWMKNGMYLGMNSSLEPHMSRHAENNMLHFTPVTLYDDGTYQCVATNLAGPHKSPNFKLLVNYGPLSMNISGPDSGREGVTVSMMCSANSRPDCDFSWFFNNLPSAVTTGSVITFSVSKFREGNYTCKARNPVTNTSMYLTKAFTVTDAASAINSPSRKGLVVLGLFASSVRMLFI